MTDRPLVVLGATGSIGRQTLEVSDQLGIGVDVLAARRPRPELAEMASRYPESSLVVTGGSSEERRWLAEAVPNTIEWGSEALVAAAARPGRTVVNGLVGAAGLAPTMAALEAGNRLALANKESLVAAGPLVMEAATRAGAQLIPVDSEHSALFQLVGASDPREIRSLVLTASGGPFRGLARPALEEVGPDAALAHPTWSMGRRISVDSATLANKGLEVIEAHVLFGVSYDDIEVVVHPQSLVHSLVGLTDGSLLAHLGATDMRIPIAYALSYPNRVESGIEFGLPGLTLQFEPVDTETFRALDLAYRAGREGGVAPCVFNAADEIAVQAFLDGRLGFLGIAEVIERTLDAVLPDPIESVAHVLEVDRQAREVASAMISGTC
ncbi:MAG TPA: 1-deoxy-D-xylulose-5-phosphate reductoisomerase [Acidimicrobiia bacterium]|nr:1-deoxy-D-xylulose-5-phosphate reductoisomerase [Acidimicrobiia bacterium]